MVAVGGIEISFPELISLPLIFNEQNYGGDKMKKLKTTLLIIIAAAFLGGCSTETFFTINSAEEGVEYYQGREINAKEDEIAKTIIEFEDYSDGFLIYYLSVENLSDENIIIHPEEIFMELVEKNNESEPKNYRSLFYALNPENEIEFINEEIESRDTWHGVSTGLNFFTAIINIVSEISDNDDDVSDVGFHIMRLGSNQINEEIDYKYTMDELNASKEFWKNEVLRKTTLNPGEEVGGLVYIPICEYAEYFSINIPVESTYHEYLYVQKIID